MKPIHHEMKNMKQIKKMKRKINQKVVVLTAVILWGTVMPTFATNVHDNFSLTISQATSRAVQRHRDLRTLSENLQLAEEAFDRAETQRTSLAPLDFQAFIDGHANAMQARVDMNQQAIDARVLRGTIGFIVTNYFAQLYMAQAELNLFDQELALIDSELAILRALVSVGFASVLDYELAVMERELVEHNRAHLVNAMEQAHVRLNRFTGSPLDRRHTLVFDLADKAFEELVVINMQGMINHQRQTHASVQQARAITDIYLFRLESHAFPVDPLTGEQIIGYFNPLTGQPIPQDTELLAQMRQASRVTADARDAIERHLQDQYVAIRRLEQQIRSLQLASEELHLQTEILQTQLQVGEILPIELERHALAIARLANELQNSKIQHHIAVMRFRNPDISPYL